MRNIFIFLIFILSVSMVYGQYNIDLRKTAPEALSYIELGNPGPIGKEIRVNNLYMEKGGKPVLPVMGEFHYVRTDNRYWRDALLKMKASGIDIVASYVMWSFHEEEEGVENWSGDRNLRKFIELCAELDLKVHLRAGPYCNAEIQNGALPDWIVNNKSLTTRSNDDIYLNHSRKWYDKVYKQVEGLLYKDGGPIMALQLENEFVKPGMVLSHLMNLKNMAVDAGFDVPIYSMTHWMDSEYPKGEIIPYAGFYLETPWITNNGKMTEPTNFEYFTFNRLSDNIGTDIIKMEGNVESFDGDKNDSPFFTCEIGVGTPTFYLRRPVVDEGMAGENINLRLGTGANLMGYYMYVGGTNPRGEKNKYGNGPFFGYDYQAPIREFGTLGLVMKETKKLNYFMNDFGSELAPMKAYLPVSNKDRDNLQWSVRTNGDNGYIFVSNHLYRYDRDNYDNVQFNLRLKNERLSIPRKPISIVNKSYFLWPFNLDMNGVKLKYSTTQPITTHISDNITTYFFFQDDDIHAEYLISDIGVKSVNAQGAKVNKEKGAYFINDVIPGQGAIINIDKSDGSKIRIVTLTEEDSDYIWKEKVNNNDFVAISESSLIVDNNKVSITGESVKQMINIYDAKNENGFNELKFNDQSEDQLKTSWKTLGPMHGANWIKIPESKFAERVFDANSLSVIEEASIRYSTDGSIKASINGKSISGDNIGEYFKADITNMIELGKNAISFSSDDTSSSVIGQIEIVYKNGVRIVWNTDDTWSDGSKNAVIVLNDKKAPKSYSKEEHLGLFEINIDEINKLSNEARLEVDFYGNTATAYIGTEPLTDKYHDGSTWILGVTRYKEKLRNNPFVLRIKGFSFDTSQIFLESNFNREKSRFPEIIKVGLKNDYTYNVN